MLVNFFLNKLQTVNGTQFSVRNSLEDWCFIIIYEISTGN